MGVQAYIESLIVTSKLDKSTTQQKCVTQNVVALQSPAEKSPIRTHLDSKTSAPVQEEAAHLETTAAWYLKEVQRNKEEARGVPYSGVKKRRNEEIKEGLLIVHAAHTGPEDCRPNKDLGLCFM